VRRLAPCHSAPFGRLVERLDPVGHRPFEDLQGYFSAYPPPPTRPYAGRPSIPLPAKREDAVRRITDTPRHPMARKNTETSTSDLLLGDNRRDGPLRTAPHLWLGTTRLRRTMGCAAATGCSTLRALGLTFSPKVGVMAREQPRAWHPLTWGCSPAHSGNACTINLLTRFPQIASGFWRDLAMRSTAMATQFQVAGLTQELGAEVVALVVEA
jgi:hypothetical protein